LKNGSKQGEKVSGNKSKIALSGEFNSVIGDKGNCSPDFAMTTRRKIYILDNFVLSVAKLLLKEFKYSLKRVQK